MSEVVKFERKPTQPDTTAPALAVMIDNLREEIVYAREQVEATFELWRAEEAPDEGQYIMFAVYRNDSVDRVCVGCCNDEKLAKKILNNEYRTHRKFWREALTRLKVSLIERRAQLAALKERDARGGLVS
jgi:hypothetical protein